MVNADPVKIFIKFYQQFQIEHPEDFEKVYAKEIEFIDPFHKVSGSDALVKYFKKMMTKVTDCRFEIGEVVRGQKEAFVCWQMILKHPHLNKGKEITVEGTTHIKFKQKIIYHRDYFDSSKLLYKHIPILGSLVRFIEKKM